MRIYALQNDESEELQLTKVEKENILKSGGTIEIVSVSRGASGIAELIEYVSSGALNIAKQNIFLATLLAPLVVARLSDIPKEYVRGIKIVEGWVDLFLNNKNYRDVQIDLNVMFNLGLMEIFKHKTEIRVAELSLAYYCCHQAATEFQIADFNTIANWSENETLDAALDAKYAILGLTDIAVKIDRQGKTQLIHKDF